MTTRDTSRLVAEIRHAHSRRADRRFVSAEICEAPTSLEQARTWAERRQRAHRDLVDRLQGLERLFGHEVYASIERAYENLGETTSEELYHLEEAVADRDYLLVEQEAREMTAAQRAAKTRAALTKALSTAVDEAETRYRRARKDPPTWLTDAVALLASLEEPF